MPVEIMLLPPWFPFHLSKISYWARTVLVPLLVLQALKPQAKNPRGVRIDELFVAPPETVRQWPKGAHQSRAWIQFFDAVDAILKRAEPLFPAGTRKRAIDRAVAFVVERLNGVDGLGAHLSRHGQQRPDVRRARLPARSSASRRGAGVDRAAPGREERTRPIASPACRRSGTRRSRLTPCSKSARRMRKPAPAPASTGSGPGRFST